MGGEGQDFLNIVDLRDGGIPPGPGAGPFLVRAGLPAQAVDFVRLQPCRVARKFLGLIPHIGGVAGKHNWGIM